MKKLIVMIVFCMVLSAGLTFAQQDSADNQTNKNIKEQIDVLNGKIDGMQEDYLTTKATVDKLSKIKISGYLQAQVRLATDTSGQLNADYTNKYDIGEFQGGKLSAASRSVFQIRRARIKAAYETSYSQMVIQLDCLPFTTGKAVSSTTQDTSGKYSVKTKTSAFLAGGGVSVKDAYLRFTDPWTKSLSFKTGIFDRPFGYEISYSSSMRESPERSRLYQTLFPGERDLGFSLEYLPGDNFPAVLQWFNFKGGFFAGNGINVEFDDMRDFIGRIGVAIPVVKLNMSIEGGLSGYAGRVKDRIDTLYEVKNSKWTGTKGYKWDDIGRQYIGGDLELFYGNLPFFGGVCLRGEVINGWQPSTKSSNVSQKSDQASTEAVYLRNISGYYGMIVLNVDPIRCQIVGKYDKFDPCKDLEGNAVTNAADMEYSTVGGGLIYHLTENVKLMAYYDKVKNEKISLAPFTTDVNDDVFTFRIQYKY